MIKESQAVPVASRWALNNKLFNVTEEQLRAAYSGTELEEKLALLPNDQEKEFMRIWTSGANGIGRLLRKMSVCLLVEVKEIGSGFVSYDYDGQLVRVEQPKNPYKVSAALEFSNADGLIEMMNQGCITIDGNKVSPKDNAIELDLLQSIQAVCNRLFFSIYL